MTYPTKGLRSGIPRIGPSSLSVTLWTENGAVWTFMGSWSIKKNIFCYYKKIRIVYNVLYSIAF